MLYSFLSELPGEEPLIFGSPPLEDSHSHGFALQGFNASIASVLGLRRFEVSGFWQKLVTCSSKAWQYKDLALPQTDMEVEKAEKVPCLNYCPFKRGVIRGSMLV